MRYFPTFLDLEGGRVVIAGGGEAALRKIRLLERTPARLEVITPALSDEIAASPSIAWVARHFEPHLLDGADLVISADDAPHAEVAAAARARAIPVNVVDRQDLSTFIVPAIVDRDPVVVAIGTEGTAPVLGQGLRARIDALLPGGIGHLARRAATLRARVGRDIPAGKRRRSFWQRLLFGDLAQAYLAGDEARFETGVEHLLVEESAAPVARVVFLDTSAAEADLMTLRAQRRLQDADVIVHDRATAPAILELARRDARRVITSFDTAANVAGLIAAASKGLNVVRLRSGAAIAEELAAAARHGVAVEIVPAVAVPAQVVSFPVRDDIRDEILRAAS